MAKRFKSLMADLHVNWKGLHSWFTDAAAVQRGLIPSSALFSPQSITILYLFRCHLNSGSPIEHTFEVGAWLVGAYFTGCVKGWRAVGDQSALQKSIASVSKVHILQMVYFLTQ